MTMNDQFLHDLLSSDDFAVESAKLEFALALKRVLEREGVSNKAFAERLGVSPPMVTKMLRGDANLTIESMVKACRQVGSKLFISIVRDGCSARLFEIAQAEKQKSFSHRAKHTFPSGGVAEDVWAAASNDIHDLDDHYEAEPVAA